MRDPAAIAAAYAEHPSVAAVALAGSRTAGAASAGSDHDLYVYLTAPLPLDVRRAIARGERVELDNRFFEPGDEWVEGGERFDVMFRDVAWLAEELERVLVRHEARTGFSTCFLHNVRTSRVLFDRTGWLSEQVSRASGPYPEPLRRAIVAKNRPLLAANLSSYLHQLERAIAREDPVAANHRAAAFLASLFDVLFAVNRVAHPGEKRLLQHAERLCPLRPPYLDRDATALVRDAGALERSAVEHAERLADATDDLLRAEGLL